MRRKDREITELSKIEDILARARVVHLGLSDDGMPYVVPMHYGYTLENGRLTLYLHSAREGRKLDVLRANANVFVEIDADEALIPKPDACGYSASFSCVMGSGKATLVEDAAEKCKGLSILMRTQTGRAFSVTEEMAQSVCVIRVDVDAFTAKQKTADAAVASQAEQRKTLSEMDNRELFAVATGDRGPIAQAYLRDVIRSYRAKFDGDADLRTMVQAVLAEEGFRP